MQNPLPIWLGVGGTPQPFARACAMGLPLMVQQLYYNAVHGQTRTRSAAGDVGHDHGLADAASRGLTIHEHA
jgi:hypothetical protein